MLRGYFIAVVGMLIVFMAANAEANRKLIEVDLRGQEKSTVLDFLRLHPDIASYGAGGEYVHVVVQEGEQEAIEGLGLPIRVIIDDIEAHDQELRKQGYLEHFHTYIDMMFEMLDMVALHPDIAKLVDIGDGWEKTQGLADRDVWALKISDNVDVEEPEEPEVLYIGCHHAREIITPEIVLHFMHYLLDNYQKDPRATYIVNNRQVWLVPMLNPDGHEYVFEVDLWWRKNRRNNGDGTRGVDLNRNYGYMWGYDDIGSSPVTSSEVYRGPAPFSEPETQAIRDFVEAHQFVISLSYHSYGNWFLYPWGYIPENTPDHESFVAIAEECTTYNHYEPGNSASGVIYPTNGDSDDWLYGEQSTKYKILAYTPEVGGDGDGFHPDTSRIMPLIMENLEPNIYVAFAAEWYAPRPEIVHTPLSDTEDLGPFLVVATITPSAFPLDPSSLWLCYITMGHEPFDSLQLLPTGLPDEYEATIPEQGNDVTISYYLSASDSLPRTGYAPPRAPGSLYSFHAGVDTVRPTIAHTPLMDQVIEAAPFSVVAAISDNLGITSVLLQYRRNAGPVDSVAMVTTANPDEYRGEMDLGTLQVGDLIEYRIVAMDAAAVPNVALHPVMGFHSFSVIEGILYDLEVDNGGFTTNAWSDWEWGVPTSGPFSAHSGTRVWATALSGPYSDNSNSRLDTPPLELINMQDPVLSFWHWYHNEFSDDIYWDGGNVKISVDGGQFELITPADGYDGIIDSWNSIIGDEPAFGGPVSTGNFWHREVIDLSPFVGHSVVVRFHFGSDAYVTTPGWYIDDICLSYTSTTVPLFAATTQWRNTDDTVGPYSITSLITDDTGIAEASLFYSVDAGTTVVQQPLAPQGDHLYRGEIPGQPYGTHIDYYLEAVDDSANARTDPPRAPESTFSFWVTDRAPEISLDPPGFVFIYRGEEVIVDTLMISNVGLIDLSFSIRDTLIFPNNPQSRLKPPPPVREVIDRALRDVTVKYPQPSISFQPKDLELIIEDPVGDLVGSATRPDIVGVYAELNAGSVTFQIEFNEDVVQDSTLVILSVDVDQNVNTGSYPPGFGDGLEWQDVGSEFELIWDVPDLYGYGSLVHVIDFFGHQHHGSAPITLVSKTITATIPLSFLDDDDGYMNVCCFAAPGEQEVSMDYAPDFGHGVVGEETNVTWLEQWPCSGVVSGESGIPVEIRVRGEFLLLGPTNEAHIVISSNDPFHPTSVVPVTVYTADVEEDQHTSSLPEKFVLDQNYPNPFNPATTIPYQIPMVGGEGARHPRVTLRVYNLLGQMVRTLVDEQQAPGYHHVVWDGRDDRGHEVASSIYFARLQVGTFSQARRLVLLR